MKNFPHHVFREYDIRGIAGTEITEDIARRLGLAYAALLPAKETRPVIVGRDVRLSGPSLMAAVIEGVLDGGRDVMDIGMGPTPLAYYGVFHLDGAGCIQVTASHNPSDYNGFKMMRDRDSLHGEAIQRIKSLMLSPLARTKQRGEVTKARIHADYKAFVTSDCTLTRPLKVVIDAGNGPSGVIAGPIYRDLGCDVIELFCEPDGTFPNHHPDPTVAENMRDISRTVIRYGADLGIAFDGDGDRIGVVDEQGCIIYGDMLLLLLSRHLLEQHPGATIISEVKCSRHMYDDITAHGGNAIMCCTGHSPIKAKMKETGALLAGEMSGHMFFADRFFGFDDAVYAGARIMQVVASQTAALSHMFENVPDSVSTPEIRVDCPDERKFDLVEEAKAYFSNLGYKIIGIDGMRLEFGDSWALLRASNTQPALVLRFEAANDARMTEIRALVEGWLGSQTFSGDP